MLFIREVCSFACDDSRLMVAYRASLGFRRITYYYSGIIYHRSFNATCSPAAWSIDHVRICCDEYKYRTSRLPHLSNNTSSIFWPTHLVAQRPQQTPKPRSRSPHQSFSNSKERGWVSLKNTLSHVVESYFIRRQRTSQRSLWLPDHCTRCNQCFNKPVLAVVEMCIE